MAIIRVYKVARGFESVVQQTPSHVAIRMCNGNGEFPGDHAFKTADVAEKAAQQFARMNGY